VPAGRFFLDPRGFERKSTGSYYTHPSLVSRLIISALEPVLQERLEEAGEDQDARELALLSIKVCDPACGSAAFLIAANNLLGAALAKIRSGEDYPAEAVVRGARRDILSHCIYGVDLNPMAVELAKVSLWINAAVSDKPLNFMDHHIKCGNSLIGTTPELLEEGVPGAAFDSVKGDDRKFASAVKKRNQREQRGEDSLHYEGGIQPDAELAVLRTVEDLASVDPERARAEYEEWEASQEHRRKVLLANLWTSAFFWPLKDGAPEPPTDGFLRRVKEGNGEPRGGVAERLKALAREHRFFHWHLEFPEVFVEGRSGFDCVLGNPPWERIKLQDQEFFATRAPEIANARTATIRRRMISKLPETERELAEAYAAAVRSSELQSKFIRKSGCFPLCGGGDVNTYAVFAELAPSLLAVDGRAGIIVPSGIAMDFTYRNFFAHFMESGRLLSLYDFENRKGIFPGVHRSYKFSLLTLGGEDVSVEDTDFAFFLLDVDDLLDPERRIPLAPGDLELLNPNTRTCPVFRSRRDAEITKSIHRHFPVLINENEPDGNPWDISLMTMFHMTNDSDLFRIRGELESDGWTLKGNAFHRDGERYLPLYEGRFGHQFNHRFAEQPGGQLHELTDAERQNPSRLIEPQYWVSEEETNARLKRRRLGSRFGMLGFCRVARNTDDRTCIATILPFGAASYGWILSLGPDTEDLVSLAAVYNSFALDYVLRNALSQPSIPQSTFEQIACPGPDTFSRATKWEPSQTIREWLTPRVLELTYTARDLGPFARELGYDGSPFGWDPERRFLLRCELDAAFFHLYNIERGDVDYIMETFAIVKRKDQERYGEYRTKHTILEIYDRMLAAASTEPRRARL